MKHKILKRIAGLALATVLLLSILGGIPHAKAEGDMTTFTAHCGIQI